MRLASVRQVLGELGIPMDNTTISGQWFNVPCPMAPWTHKDGIDRNPSFGISFSEDGSSASFYKCFSCGAKGRLSLLPAKLGYLRGDDASDFQPLVQKVERMEYAEDTTTKEAPTWEDEKPAEEKAREHTGLPRYGSALFHPYLATRGFGWKDAWHLGLRFDEAQQRILFPVYNNRLQLEGYNGRSVMPNHRLHKKNPKSRDYHGLDKRRLFMFNPHYYKNPDKHKLILNEGAFDYARGQQAGFIGAHGTMGTSLTDEKIQLLIEHGRPIFMFFDADKAGQDAVYGSLNIQTGLRSDRHLAWAYRLYQHVPVWICQYPDSALREERLDPGTLTTYEYRWAVDHATIFIGRDPTNDIAGIDDDIPF